MSLAKQVASWFEQNSQPFAGESAIAWVQAHWPELAQISTRQLSGADLILIRQRIKQIPTGKQRLYRQGLNDLLYYLSSVCHWSLPVSQQQYFLDREQIWFGALTEKAAIMSCNATLMMFSLNAATKAAIYITTRIAAVADGVT